MHRNRMTRRERVLALVLAAVGTVALATACEEQESTTQEDKADQRQETLDALAEQHPINDPNWSNDLENIGRWVDTWGTAESAEGKLSYVYLMDMEGDMVGYYIVQGSPTAKCRMSTPPYEFVDYPGDGDSYPDAQVDAPSLSGTWGGSGECGLYFAFDALTGAYMEWMTGSGLSHLVYDAPLGLPDGVNPPALGNTTIEEVEAQ